MNFPAPKLLFTTLAVLWLLASAAAQAEPRWLLVFNTSSSMKKRLPAVEAEVKTLLMTEFSRGLHAEDSVGVWTLNDRLHTGQFPLLVWSPERAPLVVSNLVAFVHRQNYSGNTSFAALQPLLDQVIADSERLTVVLICDGEDELHGTPYDGGLNETIKQTRDARKTLHQPFVIVLRTQLGKFVGATVNFPPVPANLPPFPLLPREIKAATPAPPTNVAAAKPPVAAQPLIIVGTHVSANTNDLPKIIIPQTPPVSPSVAVVVKTNPPPANLAPAPVAVRPPPPRVLSPPAAAVVAVTNIAAPATNSAAAPTTNAGTAEDGLSRWLIYIGGGILAAAVALVVFLARRGRRGSHSSLITSSMENDSRPPGQK